MLNLLTEIIGAFIVIFFVEGLLRTASKEMRDEVAVLKGSLDVILLAWDRGDVTFNEVVEAEQWTSWNKWIQDGEITGWYELYEVVQYGKGLTPHLYLAAVRELEKVQRMVIQKGQSPSEKEKIRQLHALLTITSE